jgi:ectoine hydroxylase-related dioxygenase (phytanoyl-CoA dioxygenase family)
MAALGPVPIAGRAGDLIIWHHALPHGSSPNRAKVPRVVQYLKMMPSQWEHNLVWK